MTRSTRATLGVLWLLAAGHLVDAQPLDPFFSVSGAWKTPGGNGVVVRRTGNGAEGVLNEVPRQIARYGYAPGQVVLRNLSITGANVKADVAVRIDDLSLVKTCPVGWARFSGTVSDTAIKGTLENGDFELDVDRQERVTGCTYVAQPGTTDASYARNSCGCSLVPPPRVVHRLKWVERRVQANLSLSQPFAEKALTVLVERFGGAKVAHAEVTWTVKKAGLTATYKTFSDAAGEAKLRMALLPSLDFVPTNQLKRPGRTLPAGTFTVTATAVGLGAVLEESGRMTLSRTGAVIDVVDRNQRSLREVVFDSHRNEARFRVRVTNPGVATPPATIHVTVHTYDQAGRRYGSTRFPMQSSGRGVYSENHDVILVPGTIGSPDPHKVRVEKEGPHVPRATTKVEVYIPEFTARRVFYAYSTPLNMARGLMRRDLRDLLATFREIERETPLTSGDPLTLLRQKKGLVRRGLAHLDDSRLSGLQQACLARQYLLVAMERGRYRRRADQATYPVSRRKTKTFYRAALDNSNGVSLTIDLAPEGTAVYVANREAQRLFQAAATRMRARLLHDLRLAPRTMASTAADLIAFPAYLTYTMAYGQTLDGQDASDVERLLAGLDLASYRLNTPRRSSFLRRVNAKMVEIREIRRVAKEFGLGIESADTLRAAAAMRRWEPNDVVLQRLFAAPVPDALKARIHAALQHVSESRLMLNLRTKLMRLDRTPRADRRKAVARDVGHVVHWLKYLEEQAFWEQKVRDGTAVSTGKNRYREARKVGDQTRLGDLEVMFEWTITGRRRRLDYALINHAEKTVCIMDVTGQLRKDHLAKTKGYASAVRRLPEFEGFKVVKAVEMYWDEKAGRFIEGLTAYF